MVGHEETMDKEHANWIISSVTFGTWTLRPIIFDESCDTFSCLLSSLRQQCQHATTEKRWSVGQLRLADAAQGWL